MSITQLKYTAVVRSTSSYPSKTAVSYCRDCSPVFGDKLLKKLLLIELQSRFGDKLLLLGIFVVCLQNRTALLKGLILIPKNPFSTAVPFWGDITWNLNGLSPKRDCGICINHSVGRTHRAGVFVTISTLLLGPQSVPFWQEGP